MLGSLTPANAILSPGMNALGSARYLLSVSSVQVILAFFIAGVRSSLLPLVLFCFLLAVNLAAYLARRESGCMNVRVGGIGSERVRKSVEIHRTNILPRYRDNVGLCPRACHGAAIQRARRVTTPVGPFPKLVQKNTRMPPESRLLPKWIWDCVTVPVSGGVVPTLE